MKAWQIILIVAGAATLIVGGAILAIGLANKNNVTNYVTNTHEVTEEFHNFNINIDTADLTFTKATDGKSQVVCEEKEKVHHEVTVTNDTLTIKTKDERAWYEKYTLFNLDFRGMKVTVYLPETTYEALKVTLSTGDVVINKDFTFTNANVSASTGKVTMACQTSEKLKVHTSTGDINLNGTNCKNLDASASTGDITIKDVEVVENIVTKTSTGKQTFENVKGNNLTANASTGNIKISNTVLNEKMEIETSTGSVRFDSSDAKTIKVEADTGSVKGTLKTSKMFSANSNTGSVKLPPIDEWDSNNGTCEITTHTGSIEISIAK